MALWKTNQDYCDEKETLDFANNVLYENVPLPIIAQILTSVNHCSAHVVWTHSKPQDLYEGAMQMHTRESNEPVALSTYTNLQVIQKYKSNDYVKTLTNTWQDYGNDVLIHGSLNSKSTVLIIIQRDCNCLAIIEPYNATTIEAHKLEYYEFLKQYNVAQGNVLYQPAALIAV